jgi:hypothetical protein
VPAQITRRFAPRDGLARRIATALGDAERESRQVLLVLGDPESASTQVIFRILERLENVEDREALLQQRQAAAAGARAPINEFKRLSEGFERLYVNVRDDQAAAHLGRAFGLDVGQLKLPVVVLLKDDGTLLEQRSFAPLDEAEQVDRPAVREFVKRHARPEQNAEDLFRAAAARARADGKRILLQQSGDKSIASRLLGRYIDRHRRLLERDYVYVSIDPNRMPRGEAVIGQLRQRGDDEPWLAVLNAEGVRLVDSDSPDGNIGFPSEPEAIDFFINEMLKPTRLTLTPAELEILRSSLTGR